MSQYLLSKSRYFTYRGYHPHAGQLAVHTSPARHRVVVAGRRSGKTLLAAREAECMLLQQGKRVWIVAPTHDLTDRVFREIWETFVENPRTRCEIVRKSWTHDHRYIRLSNGSFVEGKTAHTPVSLVGEGLDLLIFDEAAKAHPLTWQRYLRPTLTDRKGRALFITTPEGRNWIYDLWGLGRRLGQPTEGEGKTRAATPPSPRDPGSTEHNERRPYPVEWASFRFPSAANPCLDPAEIEQARHELSDEAFTQEYEAQFITFAARVYKEFDEALHVQRCPFDPSRPLYRAIDFGYRNPFVCLWLQTDAEDCFQVIDEYYATRKTTAENGQAILQRERDRGYPAPRQSFCDPSAAEARAVLRGLGIPSHARPSPVMTGIEMIRELLRLRPDGQPGLLVDLGCQKTIREFNLYRYPGDGDYTAASEGFGGSGHGENPLPSEDHCMDALRYAVVGLQQPTAGPPVDKPPGW